MSRKIVKYLMHKNNDGNNITPLFIDNGGYFPDNNTLIGVTYDDSEIYIPETLTVLTKAELITFVKGLSFDDAEGNSKSVKEKKIMAEKWLSNNIN